MKKEKKDLFYGVCENGTVDVVVDTYNINYWNLECVKKDFPESDYNYIEVKGDVE